jgi:hypothetical protein
MARTAFKLAVATVLTLASWALQVGVIRAQSNSYNLKPYDIRDPMWTYVDVATKGRFAGWNADCRTGRISAGFMLFRVDEAAMTVTPVAIDVYTGARPDVQAFMAVTRCYGGAMDVHLGWTIIPKSPEPVGNYLYIVQVSDIPYGQTCGWDSSNGFWCGWVTNSVYQRIKQ